MFSAFTVGLFVWREEEEVVHIDNEPSFSDHITERVVHELLECRRGVGKSKEHYHWFEEAFVCDEGGFPLVAVFDADIVISPMDVELGEQFGVLEFVDEVGDEWEWIGVSSGVFI